MPQYHQNFDILNLKFYNNSINNIEYKFPVREKNKV